MALLIFDGYAIVNGIIAKEYNTKQNESVELTLFSRPSCFFYDILTINDDKLLSNNRLKIIDWGKAYEICALPEPSSPPPLAIKQQGYKYRNKEYLLTIYKDNMLKVLLENDSEHFPYAPTTEINSPQIEINEIDNSLLFTITASCSEGSYILVLKAYPKIEKVFEDFGESITTDNGNITVRKALDDMCMRKIVAKYEYKNDKYGITSNMFNYTNEHIYIQELKPYLLLEAIKVGDIDAARSFLSTDLADSADCLSDYFGTIIDIDYPKYANYADNCVAVINDDNKVRYYIFESVDGQITNIKELQ